MHGQWDGVLFEGNTMTQAASEMGCYGFSINPGYSTAEWMRNVVLRGNTIVNLGGCGICLSAAPGALVENNLIVNTQAAYHAGITIGGGVDPGDAPDTDAIVRNNTLYLERNTGDAIRSIGGSNLQVVSNLIYFGAAADPGAYCFRHTALSNYAAIDNNLCHHAGSNGAWSSTHASLAAARAAGFDVNGQSGDPLFVAVPTAASPWSDRFQAGSPAIDRGHATLSSRTDRLGVARVVPDIGARE